MGSLVRVVSLPVRLSACISTVPTGRICVKFNIRGQLRKSLEKVRIWRKSGINIGPCSWSPKCDFFCFHNVTLCVYYLSCLHFYIVLFTGCPCACRVRCFCARVCLSVCLAACLYLPHNSLILPAGWWSDKAVVREVSGLFFGRFSDSHFELAVVSP